MSRSKWKGPYVNYKTLKTVFNIYNKQKNNKFIISRNSEIIPKFLGLTFLIHNGGNYSELTVTGEMIGHKFGEFSFTRTTKFYSKKKIKKKIFKKKIKKKN